MRIVDNGVVEVELERIYAGGHHVQSGQEEEDFVVGVGCCKLLIGSIVGEVDLSSGEVDNFGVILNDRGHACDICLSYVIGTRVDE